MSERAEFFDWLRKNRVHFKMTWDPIDVAYFAIHMNGFTPSLVYEVLAHFDHALCGMDFKKSARQEEERFKSALVLIGAEYPLHDQWDDYLNYATKGVEFSEVAR